MNVIIGAASPLRLYERGHLALLLFALLGLLTFAAVREMAGQCRTEANCLAVGNGCLAVSKGLALAAGGQTARCELTAWGWLRLAVSERTAEILREVGIPISHI
jgi:hypothetical protein